MTAGSLTVAHMLHSPASACLNMGCHLRWIAQRMLPGLQCRPAFRWSESKHPCLEPPGYACSRIGHAPVAVVLWDLRRSPNRAVTFKSEADKHRGKSLIDFICSQVQSILDLSFNSICFVYLFSIDYSPVQSSLPVRGSSAPYVVGV